MSYIGNQPISAAFLTDTFSGNGSTVAFTMSVAPANTSSILVAVTGVVQDPSTYSVSGTTLTFSAAPPSGTSNISVRYLGIPASGVTTTAYRTQTEFTATAGQTTFSVPSYTVGYIDVYRNGLLLGSSDFTATTGTTVVLANACTAGDFVETVSFYVSSVLNAIQQYNGLSVNQVLTTPTANTLTSASGSNLQLQTNGGTTALTFDTAQNAGLGVTPSTWTVGKALEINTAGMGVWAYSSRAALTANYNYNGADKFAGTGYAAFLSVANDGLFRWYQSTASGSAGGTATMTQAMTLDASGNLGIGTSSPTDSNGFSRALDLNGPSGAAYYARTNGSSTNYTYFGNYGTSGYINNVGAGALLFFNNGSERMRIDSNGNLLVGVTSAVNRLYVKATATGTVTNYLEHSGASPYGLQIYYSAAAPNGIGNEFIYCSDTSNNRFIVYSNGNVVNRNNSYGAISDIKLKENITDATPKLAQLSQVRVVNYNLIGEEKKQIGVIAQELEQIFPGMVEESNDYENVTTTDEEGNEKTERVLTGTTTKQVKYSVFVPMLIKAIQEQQAIIEQLQADVAALKGQA